MSGIVVIENQNVKITERQTDIRQNLMRKVHLSLEPNKCLTLNVYTSLKISRSKIYVYKNIIYKST